MKGNRHSILIVIFLMLSACAEPPTSQVETTPSPQKETEKHGGQVHWSYEGEEGPTNWGKLDSAYALCGSGAKQSPINVSNVVSQDLENIAFHYQPSEMRIINNGHTVQVNYDAGSYIEIGGQRYDLLQFHYHAPSEHHVNGKPFAAELHLVHKNPAGQFAVIGLLLEKGAENPAYQPFISNLPSQKSEEMTPGVKISAVNLLPAKQTTYRYTGSLTTPPCTEGVNWFLMTTPVQLAETQLAQLEQVFKDNNRPIQPINARGLEEDSTP